MKKIACLIVGLFIFALHIRAQENLQYNLLSRKYYLEHSPDFKLFGDRSKALSEEYGDEFLSFETQYVQVYNYATYYKWFFKRFESVFVDCETYDFYFRERDTENMFMYISQKQSIITLLLLNSKVVSRMNAKELQKFVAQKE